MPHCHDCEHGPKYHDEFKSLANDVRGAIKQFSHGHFMQAIEDMETIAVRLERLHHDQLGRNIN